MSQETYETNNYLLLRDVAFDDSTKMEIVDPKVIAEFQKDETLVTKKLEKLVPFKPHSQEFAMIWACLNAVHKKYSWSSINRNLWQDFCIYLKAKKIPLTMTWIGSDYLEGFAMEAFKMAFKYNLIKTVSHKGKLNNTVRIFVDVPFANFDFNFQEAIHTSLNRHNAYIHQKHNDEFLLTLHIAKEVYKCFNMPTIKPVNKDVIGQGGFIVDSNACPVPLQKHNFNLLGMNLWCEDKGEFYANFFIGHSENFFVKEQRGGLHHLADEMGWTLGALAVEANVAMGVSANSNFFYRVSDVFMGTAKERPFPDDNCFRRENVWPDSCEMKPKKNYAFILDKAVDGESFVPNPAKQHFSSGNESRHFYAKNPVFKKYARRDIQALTTDQLKDRLVELYEGTNETPFFLKTISGKFVIDVFGQKLKKSTYAVKEGRNGIDLETFRRRSFPYLQDLESEPNYSELLREELYGNMCKVSIYGSSTTNYSYLSTLQHNLDPQWIVSDIVDMHDEYRIFIVNHKVVVGSPCHRRSTPMNMFPIGRFNPGLCFSHRSKFIRLNQKTRDRVAKYIRFARAFAKDMKTYGKKHKDYDTAIHGNYILDVAWSNSKQDVVAIEINECQEDNPGNAGMYAMNTVKLVNAYLKDRKEPYKKEYTVNFIKWMLTFGFHESTFEKNVYSFHPIEKYISNAYLPVILKDVIDTGKEDEKHRFVKNVYLEEAKKQLDEHELFKINRVDTSS